jgi:hypothetical protein
LRAYLSLEDLCAGNSIGELPARCSLALVSDTFGSGIRFVLSGGCRIVNREDLARGCRSPNAVLRIWGIKVVSLMPFLFIADSRTARGPKPRSIEVQSSCLA